MSEWTMIGTMTMAGALFAIGGTGFKWARRFLLPALLVFIGAFSGVLWGKEHHIGENSLCFVGIVSPACG
jgi:hypothetical protein